MSDSLPLQDLTCTHCGSPIKTTDKPGTTITCNCCGSAFLIPEVSQQTVINNIGIRLNGVTIAGDLVGGNKIVANGSVIQVEKDGKVVVVQKNDRDGSESTQ
jgi:DNA-directed RNA polymerase subunit RPC12/RpoP